RPSLGPVLIWLLVAAVVGALIDVPTWSIKLPQAGAVEAWADNGYLVSQVVIRTLVAVYLIMILRTSLKKEHLALIRLLFGGVATTVVYAINKLFLKETYGKVRPCNLFETGGNCPDVGNFSYPSNHAVIAFGLAMGLAFAIPWLAYLTFPLAIIEAVARVLAGHHFPHDVIAGAVLGALAVLGLLLMFVHIEARLAEKLTTARAKLRAGS